ncbi:MAG: bifunctional UDP-N-acetylglucosamine diphosphorylase/glucosamine-1-phosphate N-acetyltransferase GlmU [Halieaceae bacterium]|jgi:bifunctional UDP-N-acetylglucosamine pyrophosphorylase/glucosamine-1-phosphate N-acetyltransferase|nr:bifunctional UDP-N-acetylglucosamine diphosphorylase/glucosamine-1-phosphate N-acetyltransferase GlmU [Halieaceae bacterium]
MSLEVIILAAGQGTRMKSSLPKVLHPLAGRPLLEHVINKALSLQPIAVHVVIGHGAEQVRDRLAGFAVNWVVQQEQLGTGHGVLQALPALSPDSTVLVLYGDVPLIASETLAGLVAAAATGPALLTAQVSDPAGYGRILRDSAGALVGVVEHKDANADQLRISEINTGLLAAPARDLMQYLPRVGNNNKQGEYYLPDILSMAVAEGRTVASCQAASELEVLGVNDRVQLNQLEREFQRRQAEQLMRSGVAVADANRLDIRGTLRCGQDVSIDVNVVIEGEVSLGDGVEIGPNCVLRDVTVAAGSTIHAMSHLQEATIGERCNVGPFARLRPGTTLAEEARVGNFVETKKADIGVGSKVNHLSYIGDCVMGDHVNIGAGTITCNYDGVNKHRTEIGAGVFIGSNSTLVAPIQIAEQGFVAAGSTITRAVGRDELAVSRSRQRNIEGWQRPGKRQNED